MSSSNSINYAELKKNAILCKICYTIDATQTYTPDKNNINEVDLFHEISNEISYIKSNLVNTRAISAISYDKSTLYISIAGSDDILDFVSDLDLNQVYPNFNIIEEIQFHEGFYSQFRSLLHNFKKIINTFLTDGGTFIYLTGHSTGGCIAAILGYYIVKIRDFKNLKIITFGAPFFTNKYGSVWFSKNIDYIRVEMDKDPIPDLPMFNNNNYYGGYYMSYADNRGRPIYPLNVLLPSYCHVCTTYICLKKNSVVINPTQAEDKSPTCFEFIKSLFNKTRNMQHHKIDTYIDRIGSV